MSQFNGLGYGYGYVQEDRDLTRAAAERHFQLQALSEQPQPTGPARRRWSGMRPVLAHRATPAVRGRRATA